jgi:hypothetical protein
VRGRSEDVRTQTHIGFVRLLTGPLMRARGRAAKGGGHSRHDRLCSERRLVPKYLISALQCRFALGLYNRICEGTIRPQKDGARTYITRAELERYVDACSAILTSERNCQKRWADRLTTGMTRKVRRRICTATSAASASLVVDDTHSLIAYGLTRLSHGAACTRNRSRTAVLPCETARRIPWTSKFLLASIRFRASKRA